MEWSVAIGVDTHKEVHAAGACDRLGRELDSLQVPACLAGYRRLLAWAERFGQPAFSIEGSGSYGAGLARFVVAAGVPVFECERPERRFAATSGRTFRKIVSVGRSARELSCAIQSRSAPVP